MKGFINYSILIAGIFILAGCGGNERPSVKISEEEQRIRDAAIVYRDAYVSGFSVLGDAKNSTNMAQSAIQSVEKTSNGWLVVFSASSSGIKEPSNQVRNIQVFIKPSGKLDKILRK